METVLIVLLVRFLVALANRSTVVAQSSNGLHQFRSKDEQSYRRSLRDGILVRNDYELALAR